MYKYPLTSFGELAHVFINPEIPIESASIALINIPSIAVVVGLVKGHRLRLVGE